MNTTIATQELQSAEMILAEVQSLRGLEDLELVLVGGGDYIQLGS